MSPPWEQLRRGLSGVQETHANHPAAGQGGRAAVKRVESTDPKPRERSIQNYAHFKIISRASSWFDNLLY